MKMIWSLFFLLTLAFSTHAMPLTFTYTGVVRSIEGSVPGGIQVGDTFTLSYTFNSLASDSDASASQGRYMSDGVPFGLSVLIRGETFFQTGTDIEINRLSKNDPTLDKFEVEGREDKLPDANVDEIDWDVFLAKDFFLNNFGDADGLPLSPFDPSSFIPASFGGDGVLSNRLEIEFDENDDFRIVGEVTAAAPVPEPATLTLLGIGFAGLAGLRRKYRD